MHTSRCDESCYELYIFYFMFPHMRSHAYRLTEIRLVNIRPVLSLSSAPSVGFTFSAVLMGIIHGTVYMQTAKAKAYESFWISLENDGDLDFSDN